MRPCLINRLIRSSNACTPSISWPVFVPLLLVYYLRFEGQRPLGLRRFRLEPMSRMVVRHLSSCSEMRFPFATTLVSRAALMRWGARSIGVRFHHSSAPPWACSTTWSKSKSPRTCRHGTRRALRSSRTFWGSSMARVAPSSSPRGMCLRVREGISAGLSARQTMSSNNLAGIQSPKRITQLAHAALQRLFGALLFLVVVQMLEGACRVGRASGGQQRVDLSFGERNPHVGLFKSVPSG